MVSFNSIVTIAVGLLVFVVLVPPAMSQIVNACSGASPPSWCSGAVGTVFSVLLPVLAIIGGALVFLKYTRFRQ